MIKRILLLCITLTALLCSSVLAEKPFDGGPITSPYLEEDHVGSGRLHYGVDIGIEAGTPICAPWSGVVEHGEGAGFVNWVTITDDTGRCLLFGDCADETMICPTGQVAAGTVIGYIGGAVDDYRGYSSGDHCHVEYHPYGYGNGIEDPVPILLSLGVQLDNYVPGTGGKFGHDNIGIPWTVEGMYQVGESINSDIKFFSEAAIKAFDYLEKGIFALLSVLCIIDFVLPIFLSGMSFSPKTFITKAMKYGFIFLMLKMWKTLFNDLFLNFVTTISGTFTGDLTTITANISQPQLLLQHGVRMVTPAINKIGSLGAMDYFRNLTTILPIYLFTLLTIGVFILLAVYIMFIYVEFYLSAAMNVCTIPFGAWKYTRFLSEGMLGHLVTSTLKLALLSIMVGLCVVCIKDSQPQDIFKTTVESTAVQHGGNSTDSYNNPYIDDIVSAANEFGIDPQIAIAIAMDESGGGTVEGIYMADGGGIFQILDGNQDCTMPDGTTGSVGDLIPNYETDPLQNCRAGMAVLKNKMLYNKDIWDAVEAYNGGGTAGYREQVERYYSEISGKPISSLGKHTITAEQMSKYIMLCLSLIGLALLTFYIPGSIMKHLGGKVELPS